MRIKATVRQQQETLPHKDQPAPTLPQIQKVLGHSRKMEAAANRHIESKNRERK
jgi:hypothetical protein